MAKRKLTSADQSTATLLMRAYSHSWRRMRRSAHEALTKVAVQRYHPIQTKEATILVSALLANPASTREQHFQRTAASTIMSILYDYPTLSSWQDGAVQDMNRASQGIARAGVWITLVEFFPWMLHIPQR